MVVVISDVDEELGNLCNWNSIASAGDQKTWSILLTRQLYDFISQVTTAHGVNINLIADFETVDISGNSSQWLAIAIPL